VKQRKIIKTGFVPKDEDEEETMECIDFDKVKEALDDTVFKTKKAAAYRGVHDLGSLVKRKVTVTLTVENIK